MNKEKFIKQIRKSMKDKAIELTKEFENGKSFKDIIKEPCLKNWSKIIHIEYYTLALIELIENIKKNPKLKKELKIETGDVDIFYNSLKKCEMCIYALYCEIEKLNLQNKQ